MIAYFLSYLLFSDYYWLSFIVLFNVPPHWNTAVLFIIFFLVCHFTAQVQCLMENSDPWIECDFRHSHRLKPVYWCCLPSPFRRTVLRGVSRGAPHSLYKHPASMSSDPPPPYPGGPSAPLIEEKNGQPGNNMNMKHVELCCFILLPHHPSESWFFFIAVKIAGAVPLCADQMLIIVTMETAILQHGFFPFVDCECGFPSLLCAVRTGPPQGQPLPPEYGPPPYEAPQPGFLPPHVPGEGPMPMPMPMPMPPPPTGAAHSTQIRRQLIRVSKQAGCHCQNKWRSVSKWF